MKTKIEITPAMAEWNSAVEEFDRATAGTFQRLDADHIIFISRQWPECPRDLALRLAALRPVETKNQ